MHSKYGPFMVGGTLLPVLLLASPVQAESSSSRSPRQEGLVEHRFGADFRDEYRWMENPDDSELRRWVGRENERLQRRLKGPLQTTLQQEFQSIFNPTFGPQAAALGMRALQSRGVDQSQLQVRRNLRVQQRPQNMIPNTVAPASELEFNQLVSPSGRFIITFDSDSASDLRKLAIIDTEQSVTREARLPDVLSVRFAAAFWESDDSFLYGTGIIGRSAGPQYGLYRHRIGTSQADDELIFGIDKPGASLSLIRAGTDWYLDIFDGTRQSFGRFDLATRTFIPIIAPQKAVYSIFAHANGVFYAVDYKKDDMGEIVTFDAQGQRTVIMSQADVGHRTIDFDLSPPILAGDNIIVTVFEDTAGRIVVFNPAASTATEIPVPFEGMVITRDFGPDIFAFLSDPARDFSVYLVNLDTGALDLLAPDSPAPLGLDLVSERVFYTAHNGQQVPIWIVRDRNTRLRPQTPMLLFGYGGFRLNNFLIRDNAYAPFLSRGGAVAIVTLPGGFEYGEAWHRAGSALNKKNVFADFEAAGEHLIDLRYTSRRRLIASGGSNGGLLVGAVINRRPELFAAAVPEVGVMDMVRYQLFTAGSFWIEEYGDSYERRDFRNLLSYSPYHNIRKGRRARYPATLVMTGDLDDRVVPGHSFKYAARLMRRNKSRRPINLLTQDWSGHGGPNSIDASIQAEVSKWTFIFKAVGIR